MKKLIVTKSQAATLSQEAVALMDQLYILRIPATQATDEMLIGLRQQFAQSEHSELEEMKKRFAPHIGQTEINGVKTFIVTPQNIKFGDEEKIILYIHGDGHIMGSATDRTGMLMTNELGIKTYSVEYQLAPEAKYPVALNECLEVYKYLLNQCSPQNITLVSTSADSTHMLAMLLKAKESGLPMPNSMALLSPSVDMSNQGDSVVSNEDRDVLNWTDQAEVLYLKPFAGSADLDDPFVSPINGITTISRNDNCYRNKGYVFERIKPPVLEIKRCRCPD